MCYLMELLGMQPRPEADLTISEQAYLRGMVSFCDVRAFRFADGAAVECRRVMMDHRSHRFVAIRPTIEEAVRAIYQRHATVAEKLFSEAMEKLP